MIRKFLCYGTNITLQSQKPELIIGQNPAFELELSLEEYWKLEALVKESEYLLASGAAKAEVSEVIRKIFKIGSIFAVQEKDRLWFNNKAEG